MEKDSYIVERVAIDNIEEIYFDTDDLSLLNHDAELLLKTKLNLSKYNKQREQVLFKSATDNVNSEDDLLLSTKEYNRKLNPIDKHPLLGKVKRSERELLLSRLEEHIQTSIAELTPVFTVNQRRLSHTLSELRTPYVGATLSQSKITSHGLSSLIVVAGFETYHQPMASITEQAQSALKNPVVQAHCSFKSEFPQFRPLSKIGYRQYYMSVTEKFPALSFFRKYPLIFNVGQILVLTLIGFLILYLIINRAGTVAASRLFSKYTTDSNVRH